MYGPDATFLGVPAADLDDPASFAHAKAVVLGAPFDGFVTTWSSGRASATITRVPTSSTATRPLISSGVAAFKIGSSF